MSALPGRSAEDPRERAWCRAAKVGPTPECRGRENTCPMGKRMGEIMFPAGLLAGQRHPGSSGAGQGDEFWECGSRTPRASRDGNAE